MNKNYVAEIKSLRDEISSIIKGIYKANELILKGLEDYNSFDIKDAKNSIKNIGERTTAIDNKIITLLALHGPEARDLREITAFLKITNELNRASSNTRSFIKGLSDLSSEIDVKIIKEYSIIMQTSTINALKLLNDMFQMDCDDEIIDVYNEVLIEENKTDTIYEMIEQEFFKKSKSEDDFKKFHDVLRTLRKSEKIADRASSMANLLKYAYGGGHLE